MKFNRNTLKLITLVIIFLTLLLIANKDIPVVDSSDHVTKANEAINENKMKSRTSSNYTILVPGASVCEGCHMSGKPFIPQASSVEPHVNGGKYCLNCHIITHEVHPTNENVTCEKCHGTNAGIPAYINGHISCNNCHNYPDPLLPSKGNIITIHKPRGINCNTCHTDTCTKCHLEEGTDERWEKRLTHFRTVSRMS